MTARILNGDVKRTQRLLWGFGRYPCELVPGEKPLVPSCWSGSSGDRSPSAIAPSGSKPFFQQRPAGSVSAASGRLLGPPVKICLEESVWGFQLLTLLEVWVTDSHMTRRKHSLNAETIQQKHLSHDSRSQEVTDNGLDQWTSRVWMGGSFCFCWLTTIINCKAMIALQLLLVYVHIIE